MQAGMIAQKLRARLSDQTDSDNGEVPGRHLSTNSRDALLKMQDKDFLQHPRYKEQQGRHSAVNAHLLIVEFARALVERMQRLDVPMFIQCMVRTKDEQAQRYREGNSRKDGKTPYPHEHCAADIIHSKFAWALSNDQWKLIGYIGKELAKQRGIAIVWGGDPAYGFHDPAHWELARWRDRAKEVLNG